MRSPSRLHWGCGPNATAGWLNADVHPHSGVDLVGDIRDGLALPDACMDYAVAIHVLQDLPWTDIPRALQELHRVLKPGAALRLALPDLDRAIDAYRQGDGAYFHVPDKDARSVGAKLVTQIIWYGSVRTPFNFDFAEELLHDAGFQRIERSSFGRTTTPYPDIVALDNRERESLFVEARKAGEETSWQGGAP
jgi:predicted SAM-dependent methyltransferase